MFFFAIPALATLVEVVLLTVTTTTVAKVTSDVYDSVVAKDAKPE
jgi:hypothetical protein